VDACWLSGKPGEGWVMAREHGEGPEATRRFPIVQMMDVDGDDTDDPNEAVAAVFGSEEFGWCVYEIEDEPESLQ
jgi:hypothetical protein